ncbi:hypothetical protein ABZ119_22875 [Streptomyces sp. NPDC006288]|uniref:hypothetical protein n=1 Tax=Streptomyces sp. NPDC006288 TaxID=3156743 RepID=UPI0033BA317F
MINKRMGWSPPFTEFKRAYLHALDPAGFGAMLVASAVSITAFLGAFGPYAQAFSTFPACGAGACAVPR